MDSKRGTLSVEEIVKLILGIAVFIFILLILFGVYNIVSGSLKEQQAKTVLNNIVYESGKMAVDETKEIIIESPKAWTIVKKENQLCFCEKIVGISCSGKNVCVDLNAYVSSSCSLVGTLGVTGGLSCVYVNSVPLKIYLTKEFGDRIEIDSLPYNPNGLTSSKYVGTISSLNANEKFRDFVVKYISTKLDLDKQNLIGYVNGLDFVKSANSENKFWRLRYDTMTGEPQYVSQINLDSVSKAEVDHARLNGVSVGGSLYNLEMDLYQIFPAN